MFLGVMPWQMLNVFGLATLRISIGTKNQQKQIFIWRISYKDDYCLMKNTWLNYLVLKNLSEVPFIPI